MTPKILSDGIFSYGIYIRSMEDCLFDDEQFFHTTDWDTHLVKLTIDLYKGIWDHRNTHLHGTTRLEAKEKLTLCILQEVRNLYEKPPYLDKKYPSITLVPLNDRLTTHSLVIMSPSSITYVTFFRSRDSLRQRFMYHYFVCQPFIEGVCKKFPP